MNREIDFPFSLPLPPPLWGRGGGRGRNEPQGGREREEKNSVNFRTLETYFCLFFNKRYINL
jgi:hypothetical protein